MILKSDFLFQQAQQILSKATTHIGIKASSKDTDNYNRVWARDSAVSALAIFSNQLLSLYPAIKSSILNLQKAASQHGQIPSNVAISESEEINGVSFGGPVGRTDTSFWWVIMTIQYLHHNPQDEEVKEVAYQQSEAIFNLAESWEFNGKHLMYVPMSSNWADEYITHGYVLYDQLLRLWALDLAGHFFKEEKWSNKANHIKNAIKIHYLFEDGLENSFYTEAQKNDLANFDLSQNFIASFSPGDRVEKYDFWSIALLFLLDIPSKESTAKLEKVISNIFIASNNKGIPGFYPLINEDDKSYQALLFNHHYRFKNHPGHFHNGGIWPVVNGFLIAGLNKVGYHSTANLLMEALIENLSIAQKNHPFAEYFDFFEAKANGVDELCFSASGYLLAFNALNNKSDFIDNLFYNQTNENSFLKSISNKTQKVIEKLGLNLNQIHAISISGESGCGKTTLSLSLKNELEKLGFNVVILHQDDYFKLPPKQNHQARINNFDHIGLQEVRSDLIEQHINNIKKQDISFIKIPQMDWVLDEEKLVNFNIQGINVVIIEGTYTALLNNLDKRIFINTNYKQTKKNRIGRNRENVTDFIEKVLAKESEIISQHQQLADIKLDHQFDIINP